MIKRIMKIYKIILPLLLSSFFILSCNNNSNDNAGNQNPVTDTTSADPTTNSLDYHPDQRQEIPSTDSSNTIGTDTINSSQATPNTGTEKSYNNAKGNKDSTH
jgi:hypothetical protein